MPKVWGLHYTVRGRVWKVNIRRAIYRQGEPVKIGLNQKFLNLAKSKNAILEIKVDDPNVVWKIEAKTFNTLGKKVINRSVPSGSMPMKELEIPRRLYNVSLSQPSPLI